MIHKERQIAGRSAANHNQKNSQTNGRLDNLMKSSKATTNGTSLARNDTEDYQQNYLQSVTTSLEQISSIPLSPKVTSDGE